MSKFVYTFFDIDLYEYYLQVLAYHITAAQEDIKALQVIILCCTVCYFLKQDLNFEHFDI